MSFTKIWVHLVWGTKNRQPLLSKEIRTTLFRHMRENAKKNNIIIDFINGYTDHVHCFLMLNQDITIAKAVQLIKGESARWVNANSLVSTKFEWANEYFAVSVSESMVDKVRDYIKNQDDHHQVTTFQEEYDKLMNIYKNKSSYLMAKA